MYMPYTQRRLLAIYCSRNTMVQSVGCITECTTQCLLLESRDVWCMCQLMKKQIGLSNIQPSSSCGICERRAYIQSAINVKSFISSIIKTAGILRPGLLIIPH